jgi:hypothetical protein
MPTVERVDIPATRLDAAPLGDERTPRRLIEQTPLSLEPFAHAIFDNFLPADRYRALVDVLATENFKPVEKFGGTRGYDSRDALYFDTVMPSSVCRHPEFWSALLADVFFNPELVQAFVDKVAPHTPFRSAKAFLERSKRLTLQVIRDRGGYSLGPHTDVSVKLGTLLLYVPEISGEFEGAGTVMFKHSDPAFSCPAGSRHYPFAGFHEAKSVPYKSNTAFLFARSARSFHGVKAVPPGRTRYVLQYSIQRVYDLP